MDGHAATRGSNENGAKYRAAESGVLVALVGDCKQHVSVTRAIQRAPAGEVLAAELCASVVEREGQYAARE
jgi:hypothetical protein